MRVQIKALARAARRFLPKKHFQHHVFLVGAQKAGTTSLHAYLLNHPMIAGGDRKELHFFDREKSYAQGLDRYRNMFPARSSATHVLDASPSYFYRQRVPARIHAYRPDAKIVVILREPVARAFSAFNHYSQSVREARYLQRMELANADSRAFYTPLTKGEIEPTLQYFLDRELAIMAGQAEGEEPALIRRGIYAPQLDRYVRLFGRGNILVLFSDDLKREPERITNEVFRFLGLEPLSDIKYPLWHVRNYTADSAGMETIRACAGHLFERDKQELLARHGIQVPW